MDYTLRPYQEECLNAIWGALPIDKHILVQGATGMGKTICFSELIKRLLSEWPYIKIAILAHRRELITQAKDKLVGVWPLAPIGVACASVSNKVEHNEPVTIGSIQTLINRVEIQQPFDIIIIDEAHRLQPINHESQYTKWLKAMKKYNPEVRVIGFTATPFRLGHGYIYGKVCRPGSDNLFEHLHYRVGLKDLQSQGFLCEFRAKQIKDISRDLKGVKKSGDYNLGDLSEVMSRKEHISSAVTAFQEHAQDRRHVVVFCTVIAHAEAVRDAFRDIGIPTDCVHSKMHTGKRDMILKMFDDGQIRIICNVGVLTEGWDSPAVDCIIMCRPTKAPALFVQMTGRGLRPHPEKTDVLILDLANNFREHGDPDNPSIIIPQREQTQGEQAEPQLKACPNCLELMDREILECPVCGHVWEVEIVDNNEKPELEDVKFTPKKEHEPETMIVDVKDFSVTPTRSKAGNDMIKIELEYSSGLYSQRVYEFMLFEGKAAHFGKKKWAELVDTEPPESHAEAVQRIGEINMSIPECVELIEDGRWWRIHDWFPDAPVEPEDPVEQSLIDDYEPETEDLPF